MGTYLHLSAKEKNNETLLQLRVLYILLPVIFVLYSGHIRAEKLFTAGVTGRAVSTDEIHIARSVFNSFLGLEDQPSTDSLLIESSSNRLEVFKETSSVTYERSRDRDIHGLLLYAEWSPSVLDLIPSVQLGLSKSRTQFKFKNGLGFLNEPLTFDIDTTDLRFDLVAKSEIQLNSMVIAGFGGGVTNVLSLKSGRLQSALLDTRVKELQFQSGGLASLHFSTQTHPELSLNIKYYRLSEIDSAELYLQLAWPIN